MITSLTAQETGTVSALAEPSGQAPTAFGINDISRRYANGRGLGRVSLQVQWGRVCSIIGPIGSGKTTLIRCTGLFEPLDSGSISIGERVWAVPKPIQNGATTRKGLGSLLGIVFQNAEPWPHLRVLDNLTLPLTRACGLTSAEAKARAEQALEQFGLEDRARSMPHQLSGGLRQRVVLARAFALRPRALLLDEVTSALDPEWTDRVRQMVREFADKGGAVISVSHKFNMIRRLSDWVAYMSGGEIVEQGRPEQVLDCPKDTGLRIFLENA
jgi:ABC-type polar amino acid transport system ATPase subunit